LRYLEDSVRENGANVPYALTLLENLSQEICTPWDYKQLAQVCLIPGDFLIWKAKYYDECDEQAQRNRDTGVPLTEDQLQGDGPFANALHQIQGMPQYFDQLRLCSKRAWRRLPDSGRESTESFLQLKQKANEPWAEFLALVKCAISHKIQHADVQRLLVKLHMRRLPKNANKLSDL
jgi:hypothetical protein